MKNYCSELFVEIGDYYFVVVCDLYVVGGCCSAVGYAWFLSGHLGDNVENTSGDLRALI